MFHFYNFLLGLCARILVRCHTQSDGGLDFRGYAWMLAHNGELATENTYPYLNADGYCRFESSTVCA